MVSTLGCRLAECTESRPKNPPQLVCWADAHGPIGQVKQRRHDGPKGSMWPDSIWLRAQGLGSKVGV